MKHIPSRYFSYSVEYEERWSIPEKYDEKVYSIPRGVLSETNKITKSAIRIAEVIQHHFPDIKLFPLVCKAAGKGWDTAGGTCNFFMFGENGSIYEFYNPAADFKAIKGKYSFEPTISGGEFFREKNIK